MVRAEDILKAIEERDGPTTNMPGVIRKGLVNAMNKGHPHEGWFFELIKSHEVLRGMVEQCIKHHQPKEQKPKRSWLRWMKQ